jgi:Leucine-rich repeat (LRR) protein
LSLKSNNFSDNLPQEIGRLRNLSTLNIGDNVLIGAIPWELEAHDSLTIIDLSHNDFSNEISDDITCLKIMCTVNVSHT